MFLSFAYLAFSAVLKLLIGRRRSEFAKDVDLWVLRHQLVVLERQAGRPALRPADRAFVAALARVLPRPRRLVLVVTPQTLLRWHRELVRRKWAQPRRSPGRPPVDPRVREPVGRFSGAHRRRPAQARRARPAGHNPPHPARKPARARAEALGVELAAVPAPASRQHAR